MNWIQGFTCIFLLIGFILVGFAGIVQSDFVAAILYLILSVFSFLAINFAFCTKCTCRFEHCALILPGKFSLFWPERADDRLISADSVTVFIALVTVFAFPLYWLWQQKILLIIFCSIFAVVHLQIRLFICRSCRNKNCPMVRGNPDVKNA